MPKVFNGMYICWLRGPHHNFKSTVLEPFLCLLALVFGVIVLLEGDIRWLLLVILHWFLKFIIQNAHEKVSIYPSINFGCMPRSFPGHTAPDHQKTSSKLDRPHTSLALNPSPGIFHTHIFPITPKIIDFGLIWPNNPFQSPTVQSLCASAKSILWLLCFLERKGHFCFVTAFFPVLPTALLTVLIEKDVLDMSCKVLATSLAFSAL